MVAITVDGQQLDAPAGAPLLEVLKDNGFYVSSLCYIDGLKPYAGCRTCLVDIEGPPGLQLSCTALVQENMSVTTNSDEVKEARKAVVAIICANHSDRCLTCHRREHCHPGDICLRDDVVTHRCLTCSKNYRCELQATCEMVGMSGYEPWVGEERSFYQHPQPPADRANPYMEFDPQMCIICTRCQRACEEKRHTGAITLGGKGWETRIAFGAGGPIHESNCDFSGACIDVCPTAALMEHPNKWVAKPETWTTTTCDSCAVGCSIKLGTVDGRGVIVRPGTGNPVSGDQICVRGRYHYDSLKPRERLGRHLIRRGQVQAPASLEDAATAAANALREASKSGTVGVLVGATATNEEAWLAARIAETLGGKADSALGPQMRAVSSALVQRVGTWRVAGDMTRLAKSTTIVVIADDLEESHNVASVRIKDAVVNNGADLVLVGALRSELVDFAKVWVRTNAGDEGATAALIADAIGGKTPMNESVAEAAKVLGPADRDSMLVVVAPNPVSPAIAGAMAGGAANLAVALWGERASENLVELPAEVNVHGLLDMGVAVEGGPNPLAGLSGLLVMRDDPTIRLPGAAEALSGIGTIVVIDDILHETAKRATVVIADGRAYGTSGTFTQGDFRVQKLQRATLPQGDGVSGHLALRAIGAGLGLELPASTDAILGEIAKANSDYQAAHDLIVGDGVRLPMSGSGKGVRVPVESVPAGDGIRVIAARDLYTAEDAAMLRHPEAEKLHRYDRIQVSEQDAARLGISDYDEIEVSDDQVTIRALANVEERVPEGHVYISSLLQGGAVVRFFADGSVPAITLLAVGSQVEARALVGAGVTTGPTGAAARPEAAPAPPPQVPLSTNEGDLEPITGDAAARQLAEVGINWRVELLASAGAAEGRRELASRLGLSASQVLEWVNRADLMRIEGITAATADLLENAGVDTVRELATRVPENLAAKLAETAEASTPSVEDVRRWVAGAKDLPPAISH